MKEAQFQMIMQQYERLVFTVCYQLVKDYHEAQNLTQETFTSAYLHIDGCQEDKYKPYLVRIAANKAKDYLKSAYFKRVQLSASDEEEDNAVSTLPLPEEEYLTKEGVHTITEKIYALKEPYKKVCVLYFLEEKSMDEIAALLKRPKKTVQTQIARAKLLLQKSLKEEGRR